MFQGEAGRKHCWITEIRTPGPEQTYWERFIECFP